MAKTLSERVQEAIDWIASEFKYLRDLHYQLSILSRFYVAKLAVINATRDENKRKELRRELVKEANLRKSLVIARYIGKAENRANRPIHDILKALHEVHDRNVQQIAREVDIPNKILLRETSVYFGTLRKHLKTLNRTIEKEAEYPDQSTEAKIQEELKDLETEVGQLETSASGLEAGLLKIKQNMPQVDFSRRRLLGKAVAGAATAVLATAGLRGTAKAQEVPSGELRRLRAQQVPFEEFHDLLGRQPATITEDGFLTSKRFKESGDLFYFIRHGFSAFEFLRGGSIYVGSVNGVFDLRSLEPFHNFPALEFFSHLEKPVKEVRILYPGTSDHLAPLQLAYVLLATNPKLNMVTFTYTDIYSYKALDFARQIATLQEVRVITEFEWEDEGNNESRKGPYQIKMKFKLPAGGRLAQVEVVFNIGMHKKGFFEEKDSCEYDILINHYNDERFIEDVFIKAREKDCSEKPYVIMGSAKNYKGEDITKYEHYLLLRGDYCEGTSQAIVHFLGKEKKKEEEKK